MSALERFRQWLVTEAAAAGAIGPREADRVDDRHIGDSLVMARGIGDVDEVWDIGSGAGLPGVPLAIGLPGKRFVLLDKSGRRVDLLRRVSRILNLENVVVKQGEIEHLSGPVAAIVSRATLPPERARHEFHRLLAPGGVAVVGGSWSRRPDHVGWESIEVDRTVLDREVWLLIMHQA
jgi:16S rRNA (guanine527-N7)-methyltransferase